MYPRPIVDVGEVGGAVFTRINAAKLMMTCVMPGEYFAPSAHAQPQSALFSTRNQTRSSSRNCCATVQRRKIWYNFN
jgi:hypothetical protein